MVDSKEFAVGIFDALARRRDQRLGKITKEELHDFWLQISDQSFDARLQIFFDMYGVLNFFSLFLSAHIRPIMKQPTVLGSLGVSGLFLNKLVSANQVRKG